MGYDNDNPGATCRDEFYPLLQNLFSNLKNANVGGLVDTTYWSSTESVDLAPSPADNAWIQYFSIALQGEESKIVDHRVRCVRIFTSIG